MAARGDKYYSKDGEVVYIEKCRDGNLLVHWADRTRVRPGSFIGTEFFETDPKKQPASGEKKASAKPVLKKTKQNAKSTFDPRPVLRKKKVPEEELPSAGSSIEKTSISGEEIPGESPKAPASCIGYTFRLLNEEGEELAVHVTGMSKAGKEVPEGTMLISSEAPLAKALASRQGTRIGYDVGPNHFKYTIVEVL